MLTKLSLRFPDRVPKEDHDKILKADSFMVSNPNYVIV